MRKRITLSHAEVIGLPEGDGPPAEFRIWKFGINNTTKGTVLFDSEAAASIMAAYADHGVDIAIDYEHQTFNSESNGKPAPAAAWFTPQVRDDGLYATNVKWSDEAAAFLKSRQYRYFSPSAEIDKDTRRVRKLLPFALTNYPATKHLEPLVAKAGVTAEESRPMRTLLTALGLKEDAEEADALSALVRLNDFQKEAMSLTEKTSSPEVLGTIAAWKQAKGQLVELSAKVEKLEGDARDKEVTLLVAQLPPVMREKAVELGKKDVSFLRAWVSEMAPLLTKATAEVKQPEIKTMSSKLSPEELMIDKLLGNKSADVDAFIAKRAEEI